MMLSVQPPPHSQKSVLFNLPFSRSGLSALTPTIFLFRKEKEGRVATISLKSVAQLPLIKHLPFPSHMGLHSRKPYPTNNATLINFPLSSDAEIFVNNRRLSMQIGAKRAKNVYAMHVVHIPTELPFCVPPLLVGKKFSDAFPEFA